METVDSTVVIYRDIPYAIISENLPSYLKNDFFKELGEILDYYKIYQKGAEFEVEGTNGDYIGADVRYKKAKDLIDKEARFLFSNPPDVYVNKNSAHTEQEKAANTVINDFLAEVLKRNHLGSKLVKAAKDCFIGKRVACMLNFNPETGISLTFLKSTEFLYEKNSTEDLVKLIAFYTTLDSSDKRQKRITKKAYEMHDDGYCYVTEKLYDGTGTLIEDILEETKTEFTYIPGVVILNDGLTNDHKGSSDIADVDAYEGLYSKLANADIDAERKSMNAVKYSIDADPASTSNLSTAPGAYWDIRSNPVTPDPKTAQVGTLESSMNYSGPLKTTLDRINNQMHAQLDVPDVNSEQLQGVITSGKTLKALYWGLTVRCNEKMLEWRPALESIALTLLDGAKLYPDSAKFYTEEPIPDMFYDIEVDNNYALPEDDQEERTMDIAEVGAMTMSRKSYMKKWRRLTDEEADEELQQILMEKQLFEDSYIPMETAAEGSEE